MFVEVAIRIEESESECTAQTKDCFTVGVGWKAKVVDDALLLRLGPVHLILEDVPRVLVFATSSRASSLPQAAYYGYSGIVLKHGSCVD